MPVVVQILSNYLYTIFQNIMGKFEGEVQALCIIITVDHTEIRKEL